jgi:Plasmid stabilisation system protein.
MQKTIFDLFDFNCSINKPFAKRIQRKIYKEIHLLSIFPNSGPIEPLLKGRSEVYRYLIIAEGKYKIIYTITKDVIIIHTIFDCRRNPKIVE